MESNLNQLAMAKWHPEMESKMAKFLTIDFKYVKNGKQQKIGYFVRICMTGEQALLSSTIFTYISLKKIFDFIFAVIFKELNVETWNYA